MILTLLQYVKKRVKSNDGKSPSGYLFDPQVASQQ